MGVVRLEFDVRSLCEEGKEVEEARAPSYVQSAATEQLTQRVLVSITCAVVRSLQATRYSFFVWEPSKSLVHRQARPCPWPLTCTLLPHANALASNVHANHICPLNAAKPLHLAVLLWVKRATAVW